jgi:protoporphyrinogen/coproporphyrinogen III oxidase
MKKKKIAVIGAGISGLTCAYELQKAGHDVEVFEKDSLVGGRMSTRTKEDLPFDIGADHLGGVYRSIESYCKELGVPWVPMIAPKYAIRRSGKLYPAYKVVKMLDQFRLAVYGKRLKKETDFFNLSTTVDEDSENVYDYSKRVLGKDSANYLAEGLINGYQFHRASEVSRGVFTAFVRTIKFDKWTLHKTQGGMIALSQAMADKLTVHLSMPVLEVIQSKEGGKNVLIFKDQERKEFDLVVISSTANITRTILKDQTIQQDHLLNQVEYSKTISLAYKLDASLLPDVTNVFTPWVESQTIASWTNQKMKGEEFIKDGKTLICAWLHEDYAKKIMHLSEEEIFSQCAEELVGICSFLSSSDQIEAYDLQKWSHAMPKHLPGFVTEVAEFLKSGQGDNNIYLCGDYLNSPWTEGSVRCGQRVATRIIKKDAE